MESYQQVFFEVAKKFHICEFNDHQKDAIITFVTEKRDIFVNLPTGFGKSLIFQALPLIFDYLFNQQGHIVVVVSPLINLIIEQVKSLRDLGIKAVNISDVESEEERQQVERGCFSIIYGTPEAWLLNQRWRNMLTNPTYSTKLCAVAIDEAHVIKQWGMSTKNTMVAFRDCYSHLHELRTLAPSVHMIALTATATKATRETIFDILLMDNRYVIFESPNKDNIAYAVEYMSKDADLEHYFGWLADELRVKKELCDRTIIYCQTIKQCGLLYATLKGMLGKDMHAGDGDFKNCLIEMLHSCTPLANKENIIKSFTAERGVIRVLVATIAFGMGVNCKAVSRIIHFGPAKNIESYAQETGRAGRDGSQAIAFLLYNGILLNHVDLDIKSYVRNHQCRRKILLKHFDEDLTPQLELHLCCDYCASVCQCGSSDCGKLTTYPSKTTKEEPDGKLRSRDITNQQKELVHKQLTTYHKRLVTNLLSTAAKTELKTLTGIPLLLGFSEIHIQQVLGDLEHIFSLADICKFVEIWDMTHARKILCIIKDVFQDVQDPPYTDCDDFEMDDTGLLEDWETILDDSELCDMAFENLSLSQLEESFTEQESNLSNVSLDVSIPDAVIETLEKADF